MQKSDIYVPVFDLEWLVRNWGTTVLSNDSKGRVHKAGLDSGTNHATQAGVGKCTSGPVTVVKRGCDVQVVCCPWQLVTC